MDLGKNLGGDAFFDMLGVELSRRAKELQADGAQHWCADVQEIFKRSPWREIFEL